MKERFWNKVRKSVDCWEWQASTNRRGYGQFKIYDRGNGKQKVMESHRLAWILTNGDIPDGMCVCHKCDNPKCVRPDHLFLGTQRDNARDMAQKGRAVDPTWFKKLTSEQVVAIRNEYAEGLSSDKIAIKRNLSKSCVLNILNGKTWKNTGGPIRDRGARFWSNRYGTGKTGGNKS